MFLALCCIFVVLLCVVIVVWSKRKRDQDELARHMITPEELRSLLAANHDVLLFDVRQPLDLLANSEIIPGARRVPPQEVLDGTSVIPKEKETVVYCTCPGEKTSREVLRRAVSLHFSNIKFLQGGLAAWKAKGYPVEPYRDVFHLYVPSSAK
jgi:rhodanese-related sulfurtransferase